MAILIDEKKRVLVQGITGREGQARTRLMREDPVKHGYDGPAAKSSRK
ncbi:hypothetical protein BH18VER2_BH18VER2_16350 [soil metagenome]